jgi:multiple sugar transport system ATP-binding protein
MPSPRRLAALVDAEVAHAVVGVRPQDCRIAGERQVRLEGRICTAELIGDHTLVTLDPSATGQRVGWGDEAKVRS